MSAIDRAAERAADRVGDVVGAVRAFVGLAVLAALLQPLAAGRHHTGDGRDDHLARRRRPAAPHPRPKESTMDMRPTLQRGRSTDRDDDRPHVVEYRPGVPFRNAGTRQKAVAPNRKAAAQTARDIRGQGGTVTAVRRKRWWE